MKEYFFKIQYFDTDHSQKDIFFTEPLVYDGDDKEFNNGWTLDPNQKNGMKIDYMSFSFSEGKINGDQIPYEISYYSNEKKILFALTGLVQNGQLVFLHPPRSKIFSKLEFSPFPQVRFPLEKNKVWKDTLTIGDHWANDSLKWSGNLEIEFEYKIVGKEKGMYIIEAKSNNEKIKTSAIFYYGNQGFSKLIFNNYDKSRIILELVNKK
ncbi:MAG: hypothetical protein LBE92_20635 [Chryseobacterium sp.]|jgi:hypothetical protein|uniref:hypothetical protein n=1 Tax=Chryseobacterium sp. TaxID=1871047 RepID=UPI00281B946B|nr:hypothetical protein [Chryseobacterium sp.]MDR2238543.1 hypothetical protein [Chryseobacterium sp.]